MARCSCNGQTCGCVIQAGDGITIEGAATAANPMVISAEGGGGGDTGWFSGDLKAVAYANTPAGWLECRGQAVSRSTYADLFDALGTLYGPGNGSTTFNVPDLRDRFIMGASTGNPLATTAGSADTTLVTANLPAHTHTINHNHPQFSTGSGGNHKHKLALSNNDGGNENTIRKGEANNGDNNGPVETGGAHTHTIDVPPYTGASGAGSGTSTPFSNLPPYAAMRYLIKT